jgi:iron complex transport system ATP-binding protein
MNEPGTPRLAAAELIVPGRLTSVSAVLRAGEVTAICGPNGAGKSTLLACLAGLLHPRAGSVTLGTEALAGLPPRVRGRAIGYLPQNPDVAWDVSVETLVSLGRIPWRGIPRSHDEQAIGTAIAAMDLDVLRNRPVSQLSGGERARALMARVLATAPQWVLADEPLANLDLAHGAQLVNRLHGQAAEGTGVVLVLHDLAQAMNHADRVLVLQEGRLVADGPPREALSENVIAEVWGVATRWLGKPGAQALAVV